MAGSSCSPDVVVGPARPCHGIDVTMVATSATDGATAYAVNGSLGADAHRAGGALDDLHRSLDVVGVEVGHLGLRDVADLLLGEPTDLLLVRHAGTLLEAGGLLDQLGRGGRLGDERERAVLVDGDLDRDHVAAHGLGLGVVGLAEVHDVDAVRAEGGTDRRRRRRCARLKLHLDQRGDLLLGRHSVGVLLSCTSWSSRAGRALPPGFLPCCSGFTLGSLWVALGLLWVRYRFALGCSQRNRTIVVPCRRRSEFCGSAAQTFWIWLKLSSTGVSRPKISTSAFAR